MKWSEAKSKAEAMDGHLAVITTQEEFDWVVANFAKGKFGSSFHFWLGASKASADTPWTWLTGEKPDEKLSHHSDDSIFNASLPIARRWLLSKQNQSVLANSMRNATMDARGNERTR